MKKSILWLTLVLICIIFMRGWLYRSLISYKPVRDRETYRCSDASLITLLKDKFPDSTTNLKPVVERTLTLTSELLYYRFSKNENDPNRLVHTHAAHCVGYAAFFATAFNQGKNLDWQATSVVGHLYFFGVDVHQFFSSSFFKDHDFVVLRNTKTGERLAVDPTLYDYTRIVFVSLRK